MADRYNPCMTPQQAAKLVQQHGGVREAARATGRSSGTVAKWYSRYMQEQGAAQRDAEEVAYEGEPEPVVEGHKHARQPHRMELPAPGEVKRYIVTSAQNNTHLHPCWSALQTAAEHLGAQLLVSRFTYNVGTYGRGNVKPGHETSMSGVWFDHRIVPYIADDRIELAPGLVLCGELNILPTAVRPLSGLETYTGRDSAIVPHAKITMESVASGKHEATKFNYTTGVVTQRNYIQKKAGQRGEQQHSYGALIVEVDDQGNWYVRQLEAEEASGEVRDLTLRFLPDGRVETSHIEAIVWGDIHAARRDKALEKLCWGQHGIIDRLRPRFQVMHDLLDMRARNHHERNDPHAMFERHTSGEASVARELADVSWFLAEAQRPATRTVVVESNHDLALKRWLKEADYRQDPLNAITFLRLQLSLYTAIRDGLEASGEFHLLENAIKMFGSRMTGEAKFLREDEAFIVCPEVGDGIELGMHGHLGPNGARGSPRALSRMGRRAVTGHTHSASIVGEVWTVGLMAHQDLGYNRGPSSWSATFAVVHDNGACQLVTIWDGKFRA